MHSGNFRIILLVTCFSLAFTLHAQVTSSFKTVIEGLKKKDDIENFTYTFIDEYLKNPTESRLSIFEDYERLVWRTRKTADEHLAYTLLLTNKGYYLTKTGNIQKAIDAYEAAWQIFITHKLTGLDIIEYCLKPLANNYVILGDYNSAANIVKNYLFISEREKNYDHIISGLINLSIIYHDTGKYNEALSALHQSLRLRYVPIEKEAIIYSNLSRNYLSLSDTKQAEHFAQKSIKLLQVIKTSEAVVQLVNVYSILSQIYLARKQTDKSFILMTRARQLAFSNRVIFKSRELAKLNNNYAELLLQRQQFAQALSLYLQSLSILMPRYTEKDSIPNTSFFYAENTIKETFDALGQLYIRNGQFEKAITYFELSFTVEDLIRKTFNYDEAKLQQQLENRNRTELILDALSILYKKNQDSNYAKRAFQVAERTKAVTVREKIEKLKTRKNLQLDSTILYERVLRTKHAMLAEEISREEMRQGEANIEHLHALLAEQTHISILLKEVEKFIGAKYDRARQSDSSQPIDLKSLQEKLTQSDAFLMEYFTGQNALYIFKVTRHSLEYHKVNELDTLKKKIIQLHELLSVSSSINANPERYKKLASDLFTDLQLPASATEKKAIIIPDGVLTLIPFDVLLYSPTTSRSYSAFPFMLKKHTIVYQPAAHIYIDETTHPPEPDHALLGIFPVFKNSKLFLEYSEKEANEIQKEVDGKYLLGDHATKKAFLENASHYPIIHLSTHASAGSFYEPPSITFIDSTLYLPQIYGLHLQTDLMILSACETGVGLLVKGEGAVSLARGFQMAGVKSIIFSLWKVNDYATTTLLTDFYKNYLNNKSKDESLREAKLNYLSNENISNNYKSPYYWSGFVYYGNTDSALHSNYKSAVLLKIFVICLLFALIGLFLYRNRMH